MDNNRINSYINSKMTGYPFYLAIEQLAVRIFSNSGFIVKQAKESSPIDFIANNEEKGYCIEVKASTALHYRSYSALEDVAYRIVDYAKHNGIVPVLLVFAVVSAEWKKKLISRFDIIVLDIANLLYTVKGTELQDELVSILPFAVDQIEPEAPDLDLGWICHEDEASSLLLQLDNCILGRDGSRRFEDVCTEFLRYLFKDELSLWKNQAPSNQRLYRFDLLCRIKDGLSSTFWHVLELYFHTKYVVFEFKNYKEKVSQSEIYTTERYLYSKALRNVAVIIARNGFDDNSIWAAKGSLREYGKLILPITVSELKEMMEIKRNHEDPSGYLLSKLDDLLIELEK